ncbi:MAG TPA: allophanate hydrolase [Xanthobacteraceae bacterium]|nr:allophanate hydrolase [Xanthobacteraceae bacterium]
MTETVAAIVEAHRSGAARPAETVARCYERIRVYNDPAVFISLREEAEAVAEAERLAAAGPEGRPLYGVPVAVKDNIDVAGMPTTAACPAYAYKPAKDSTAVERLRRAGAIVIGKTNLDQFATGLVGVRSPYGIPRNTMRPDLIPGGSSSGSAVAVAAGLVPLALGTDTAGSGRVPAGFNNIVGLKPSLGLVSTAGLVPACRTLDCVSVFALTTDDAFAALKAIAGPDAADPFSRRRPLGELGAVPQGVRIGAPMRGQRLFFGASRFAEAYEAALARCTALGLTVTDINIEPFYETARLLYDGPWLAERFIVLRNLLASAPDDIHQVTAQIIIDGELPTAVDAFAAFYKLEELRRLSDRVFQDVDALLLPTVPTVYTIEQVMADPIGLNSRLGTYTNFVNLLDLCGLAIPSSRFDDGAPFGVTLLAPAGNDALLASLGRVLHAASALPLGALGLPQPVLKPLPAAAMKGEVAIAVVGAHLSGMPLNGELKSCGARFLEATSTAPSYRMFALAGGGVAKPGLVRVADGKGTNSEGANGEGVCIEVEIWAMPADGFGRFVAMVPPPLSIGTLGLADGRSVKGFLVEQVAIAGCRDISHFGGWRAFCAEADPRRGTR